MTDELQDGLDLDGGGDNTPENETNTETLLIQKKKMREQRDQARQEAETLKQRLAMLEAAQGQANPDATVVQMQQEIEHVKFATMHRDLDAEEIQEVFLQARARGISAEEAMKLPVVTSYLTSRQEAKTKDNDVPQTTRSAKFTPPKPVSSMTPEEHRAYWEKTIRGGRP